jgi:hypothetical protein
MAGLLDQVADNPIGGLMSLLTPIVTGGAMTPARGQLLSPGEIDQTAPAWLAFAQRMANAGAPTLGPPTTFGQALTGAMGAGYSAERQQQMLPLLLSAAQREQESGQLALDQQRQMNPIAVEAARTAQREKDLAIQKGEFDLNRDRYWENISRGIVGKTDGGKTPPTDGAGPAGGAPIPPAGTDLGKRSDLGPAAGPAELAALPDVRRLPDQTRVPFMQAATQIGMPLPVASQYARMLIAEGQGLHVDPETGKPWVSSAGAIGAGGVMPGTFRDMQNKYGFSGNVTDLMPNLLAGGHYFMDQASDHGMHGGVIAYNAGPRGLERYLASGRLPAETADYLTKTGATGPDGMPMAGVRPRSEATAPANLAQPNLRPVQVAGPGAPTEAGAEAPGPGALNLPGGQGPASADLVRDPLTHAMVPSAVLDAARAAIVTPGPPGTGIAAYQKVIAAYVAETASKGRMIAVPPDVLLRNGYDPRVPMTATLLPDGKMTDLKPSGGRNPLAQIETEINMRNDYLTNPVVKQYDTARNFLDRMRGTMEDMKTREPTALDDLSLLKNFAHLNDPNAVVKVGDEASVYTSEGAQSDLKQMWQRVAGGSKLLDKQREDLWNSAQAELAGMEAGAHEWLLKHRGYAELAGVRPDAIGIPGKLSERAARIMASTPATAAGPGMPTAPTGQSLTIPRPGINAPASAIPSPREIGTAALPPAPAATPPPAAQNTGPPATKDRFTADQWKGFTSPGLANIADDMVKNPGHYSVRDRQRLLEAAQAARPK